MAAEISSAGRRASSYGCDVSNQAEVAARFAEISGRERIDLLVNNAGVSVAGPVECLTLADFHSAMEVNFWGVVHGCQAFLPHLRAAARRGERDPVRSDNPPAG